MPATQPLYIVQRIEWNYSDEWFYQDGDTPLKAFADRDAAERYRQKLENEARAELLGHPATDDHVEWWSANLGNTFGELSNLTSLSEEEFDNKVREIGLRELSIQHSVWHDGVFLYDSSWWRDAWAALAPDRTELLWNLLDRLRFFDIVEIEGPPLSQQIFIAQVKPEFRFPSPYENEQEEVSPTESVTFAFNNRQEAEQWIQEHTPTDLNPFNDAFRDDNDKNLLIIYYREARREFRHWHKESQLHKRKVALEQLNAVVRSLGMGVSNFILIRNP